MAKHRVIFDTDPGVDDAMALMFLRAHPDIEIVAITAVFGNAAVEITTRNALYLTERFGIDAPVYAGASDPVVMARLEAPAFVHGHDGLGDVGVTEGFSGSPAPGFAPDKIIELVRASPGEITLLAVGPFTNLAMALDKDPEIAGLVREVVVMGGVFSFAGQVGNVSPVAEANIRNDPDAADKVFSAPWPVTVVGLDVTSQCVLAGPRARRIADEAGEAGQFLWDISRSYEAMYQQRDHIAGCCLHDVAAAICVVRPELFTMSKGPIRAVTGGIAIGQTIQQRDDKTFPPGPWDGLPSQKACADVDAEALVDFYHQTLVDGR